MLALPGRNNRVIDGDMEQRQVAVRDKAAQTTLERFVDRDFAPPVRWADDTPIGNGVERGRRALRSQVFELLDLDRRGSVIGWRSNAVLAGTVYYPCFPLPNPRLA
jgi:hypothetical protein